MLGVWSHFLNQNKSEYICWKGIFGWKKKREKWGFVPKFFEKTGKWGFRPQILWKMEKSGIFFKKREFFPEKREKFCEIKEFSFRSRKLDFASRKFQHSWQFSRQNRENWLVEFGFYKEKRTCFVLRNRSMPYNLFKIGQRF